MILFCYISNCIKPHGYEYTHAVNLQIVSPFVFAVEHQVDEVKVLLRSPPAGRSLHFLSIFIYDFSLLEAIDDR